MRRANHARRFGSHPWRFGAASSMAPSSSSVPHDESADEAGPRGQDCGGCGGCGARGGRSVLSSLLSSVARALVRSGSPTSSSGRSLSRSGSRSRRALALSRSRSRSHLLSLSRRAQSRDSCSRLSRSTVPMRTNCCSTNSRRNRSLRANDRATAASSMGTRLEKSMEGAAAPKHSADMAVWSRCPRYVIKTTTTVHAKGRRPATEATAPRMRHCAYANAVASPAASDESSSGPLLVVLHMPPSGRPRASDSA
mmetsp:Transcript_5915/g.11693  ORF Transcript_5915/g.11693 Transcript_5915/m.11693 type:complete len:253 (-) Transcript_5915:430-1188(-)